MKYIFIVVIPFIFIGCGSVQSNVSCLNGNECTSYALVSESEAKGLAATVTGDSAVCKVSVFGDVSAWQVSYKGDKCEAVLNEIP